MLLKISVPLLARLRGHDVEVCDSGESCVAATHEAQGKYPVIRPLVPEHPATHLREVFTQRLVNAVWEVGSGSTRLFLFQGSLLAWYRNATVMYSDHDIDFGFFGDVTDAVMTMFRKLTRHADISPFIREWMGAATCEGLPVGVQKFGCGSHWNFKKVPRAKGSSIKLDLPRLMSAHPDMATKEIQQLYYPISLGLGCVLGAPAFIPISATWKTPSQVLQDQYGPNWRVQQDVRRQEDGYVGHANYMVIGESSFLQNGTMHHSTEVGPHPVEVASRGTFACQPSKHPEPGSSPTPDRLYHSYLDRPIVQLLRPGQHSNTDGHMTMKKLCDAGHYVLIYFDDQTTKDTLFATHINKARHSVLSQGVKLEALFVGVINTSLQASAASMVGGHIARMKPPWWRLANAGDGDLLAQYFTVWEIPRVVIISPGLIVLNLDAASRIIRDPATNDFPWVQPRSSLRAADVPAFDAVLEKRPNNKGHKGFQLTDDVTMQIDAFEDDNILFAVT